MTFMPEVFPKVPSYRREADRVHLARSVVCLEKIDGANTRVAAPRGAAREESLVVGGRTLLEGDAGFCQPELRAAFPAAGALLRYGAELDGDVALYGETCGRGVQASGFVYGPRPHFVLFAARACGAWLSHSHPTELDGDEDAPARRLPSLTELAERLGLPLAPCLYRGAPDPARFDALLERPSAHGERMRAGGRGPGGTHEGVVIWSDPLLLDGAGRPLVAKLKHPRRREAEDAATGAETPESFARRVVNRERLAHAAQHLREGGRWCDDAGERAARLVRRVVQDVAREEPAYPSLLAQHGKARVRDALEAAARDALAQEG